MAEQGVTVARQECERLDREMAEALKAQDQLDALRAELEPIEWLKREQEALEHLQKEETARRADEGQLAELMRTIVGLDRRIAELAPAGDALAGVEREAHALAGRLEVAERAAEEQRAAWVREKEYATTRRADLLKQYDEVKEQRDKIEQLGPRERARRVAGRSAPSMPRCWASWTARCRRSWRTGSTSGSGSSS